MSTTKAGAEGQATAESGGNRVSKPAGRYTIAVLTKALDLIDLLEAHEALTLTELSGRAGINKATALRVLANLEERGYVEREAGTGRYRLGFRLLQLGARLTEGLDLRTVARPVLKRLHAEFDETVNLAVAAADGIVYIDILQSARGLRMAAMVGSRDDFHSSALGKAIMAQWPAAAVDEFLCRRPPVRKTPKTIVEPGPLTRELALARERGYAVDDEENELGARCVGAPVVDHRGSVVGAISLSGPASRLTPDRIEGLATRLVEASREISARMGFKEAGLARPAGSAPRDRPNPTP